MINILRKNQKGLWIVIAVLCIPFVFYFSNSNIGAVRSNQFGRLYDRPISNLEFQRNTRLFNLARELGMYTYLQDLVAGATTQNEAYADFTWNRLILRHEAERLGIQPVSQDVANVVKGLRAFQGEKGFDINKYNEVTQGMLPSMGFNEAQIEELAEDQLMLDRIKEVVGLGMQVPDSESQENYERAYGKLNVSVVRVRSDDLAKGVQMSDDDIAKYFEAQKAQLVTEEKRKVSFVTFALSEEQKKLAGKERVEVLQKLADKANDFSQGLLAKDAQFEQVAAKFQLPIQTSGEFTKSAPDPLLNGNAQLASSAFQLTAQEPNSDAIQVADGFYLLHLNGIEAARPLTLEEAKPRVVEAIKSQRTRELVSSKGAELTQKIRGAIKPGTPLDSAFKQAGLAPEKIPPFSLADQPKMKPDPNKQAQTEPEAPDLAMIKGAVADMGPGEVSEFVPTQTGGLVAVLEKRDPPTEVTNAADKAVFTARVLKGKRDVAFYEWLHERRDEAGVPKTAEPVS